MDITMPGLAGSIPPAAILPPEYHSRGEQVAVATIVRPSREDGAPVTPPPLDPQTIPQVPIAVETTVIYEDEDLTISIEVPSEEFIAAVGVEKYQAFLELLQASIADLVSASRAAGQLNTPPNLTIRLSTEDSTMRAEYDSETDSIVVYPGLIDLAHPIDSLLVFQHEFTHFACSDNVIVPPLFRGGLSEETFLAKLDIFIQSGPQGLDFENEEDQKFLTAFIDWAPELVNFLAEGYDQLRALEALSHLPASFIEKYGQENIDQAVAVIYAVNVVHVACIRALVSPEIFDQAWASGDMSLITNKLAEKYGVSEEDALALMQDPLELNDWLNERKLDPVQLTGLPKIVIGSYYNGLAEMMMSVEEYELAGDDVPLLSGQTPPVEAPPAEISLPQIPQPDPNSMPKPAQFSGNSFDHLIPPEIISDGSN